LTAASAGVSAVLKLQEEEEVVALAKEEVLMEVVQAAAVLAV